MGRKPGIQYRDTDFWRVDDRTGFPTRASQTRKEWTGLVVSEEVWEPRNAQDFVKGVADNQTVPDARPLTPDLFTGPIYVQLTATANLGATFLTLGSISGLTAGDAIGVMLDTGTYFKTTINGAPISTGINITNPLPYRATSGNLMIDYEG